VPNYFTYITFDLHSVHDLNVLPPGVMYTKNVHKSGGGGV